MYKLSVTVAISAYNEEKNIKNFLKSVLKQKEDGFRLDKIWVYSDGSTDNTVKEVKSLKSSKIVIFEDMQRVGKSTRLNQIYNILESDILVQSDADVVLSDRHVIRNLINPFINEKKVGMTGGNPIPLRGTTWLERAINYTCEAYNHFRHSVRGGNNVFSADGRLLAFRRTLVKKILVPRDMIANDAFTYFCCLTEGYVYNFVPKAVVNYRSPQNLKDHIRQNTRFQAAPIRMAKYFDLRLVNYETSIPENMRLLTFLKVFIKHPVSCLTIFLINRYCYLLARLQETRMNAKWDIALSTKTSL